MFQRSHPFKLGEFNGGIEKSNKRKRENQDEPESITPKLKQVNLTKCVETNSRKKVNKAVIRFVVGTGSPFSVVEHPDFQHLLNVCGGNIPPNRKQLMDELHESFCAMVEELKDNLKNISTVCVTADCWTVFKRSYLGMTVHWIDPVTMERKSMGISCKRILGRHTYDILADAIESILEDYGIKNKTKMIVTDNGSNFTKAFRIFGAPDEPEPTDDNIPSTSSEDFDESELETCVEINDILDANEDARRLPPHHCCTAHTLNLLATKDAEEALTSPSYKRISRQVLAKCQVLFNKQNMSTLAADIIFKHLGRYLVVPGATRWNSLFDSLQLLLSKVEKLDDICRDLGVPLFKKPSETDFLKEYCQVLEPVATALDILQGEREIFMGYLLPTLKCVRTTLVDQDGLEYCQPLRNALIAGFDKRFSHLLSKSEFRLSAFLLPKFKLDWLEEERPLAREDLLEVIKKELRKNHVPQPGENSDAVGKKQSKMDSFFSKVVKNSANLEVTAAAEGELLQYLHNSDGPSSLSPLMKKVFIQYNTAVPSSAHCERMFSCAGLLFSERRGRMADLSFEQQMLLKFNRCFEKD